MEVWKTRPGLEATLMRTINYNHRLSPESLAWLRQLHLDQRYAFWITTDEARVSASSAIQDVFITKKKNLEKAFKRLHFSKINSVDYDLFIEIFKSV